MKSWRAPLLILLAVVLTAALPLLIRGCMRVHALNKFCSHPGVRQRLAVVPTKRTFAAAPTAGRIDIGYATFSLGGETPRVETDNRFPVITVVASDFHVAFLPPFNPQKEIKPAFDAAAQDSKRSPAMRKELALWATGEVAREIRVEETRPLTLRELFFMPADEFETYVFRAAEKGTFASCGANEVFSFTSPTAKGVVRIGSSPSDRHRIQAMIVSPDNIRGVSVIFNVENPPPTGLPPAVESLLASFAFTVDRIEGDEQIKKLILGKGIPAAAE